MLNQPILGGNVMVEKSITEILVIGQLTVDGDTLSMPGMRSVHIIPRQRLLIKIFEMHRGVALKLSTIVGELRKIGHAQALKLDTARSMIGALRSNLACLGIADWLKSVEGVGYCWCPPI
jgi:DNA-binding response OmpR family regulator